jgi:hypothetical protein
MIKNRAQLEAAASISYGIGHSYIPGFEIIWDRDEKDCSDAYRVAGWTL